MLPHKRLWHCTITIQIFNVTFKHHSWKYWVTSLETTPNGTITILINENGQDVITKKLTIIGQHGDLKSDALKDWDFALEDAIIQGVYLALTNQIIILIVIPS
jgi:hypothetical protein